MGRVRGYQYGHPSAFKYNINDYNYFSSEIRTFGVTLTCGNNPCKHAWTYAESYQEQGTRLYNCPCNNGSQYMNYTIPFVGNDYYCKSGTNNYIYWKCYPNDPFWDGQDCHGDESTCCTSPKMPWFIKTLNETANDDIELTYVVIMTIPLRILGVLLLTLLNFISNNMYTPTHLFTHPHTIMNYATYYLALITKIYSII